MKKSVKNSNIPLKKGTRVTNKLKVNVQQKTKALFVTRLEVEVTPEEMSDYISENAKINPLKCVKLKTRYPSYSSFYILLNLDDYEQIANPEFWPDGVLYTQFLGRLRHDTSITTNESEVNNQGSTISAPTTTKVYKASDGELNVNTGPQSVLSINNNE